MKTKVNFLYKHIVKILKENSSNSNQLNFNKICKNPIRTAANQFHHKQIFISRMQQCFSTKNVLVRFTTIHTKGEKNPQEDLRQHYTASISD